VLGESGGFTLASDKGSKQREKYGVRDSALEDEEGVLLQPDFEFDEEGNIVDLPSELPLGRAARQRNIQTSEPTVRGQVIVDVEGEIIPQHQQVK
jgi:meiotic recombination protein REC8